MSLLLTFLSIFLLRQRSNLTINSLNLIIFFFLFFELLYCSHDNLIYLFWFLSQIFLILCMFYCYQRTFCLPATFVPAAEQLFSWSGYNIWDRWPILVWWPSGLSSWIAYWSEQRVGSSNPAFVWKMSPPRYVWKNQNEEKY